MSRQKRFKRLSGALALLVVGTILGATLVTPAAAHVGSSIGHLWLAHIRPLVRSYGDGRWMGKTKVAAYGSVEASSTSYIDDFTATDATLVAKTFTAPSPGYILVIASISAEDDNTLGGIGELYYRLWLDGTPVNNQQDMYAIGSDTAGGRDAGSASAVLKVSAGTHTVALKGTENGGGTFVFGRDLSILFVPNGSGLSAIPLPAPTRGAPRNQP